jgi:Rrf2 family transcriptional regulator, iron-sulfur cluster assembly transcription factor
VFKYGKTTQTAIAAMSRLAEVYDGGKTRLSSGDIAKERHLSKPLAAKLLTILSQARLVGGSPGPGGGYTLSRPPGQISLYDVAILFERPDQERTCPFGSGWCGHGEPCPLHYGLLALDEQMVDFLRNTHFDVFQSGSKAKARP